MAIRNVRTFSDEALHKVCRPYTEFGERLHTLLDDMKDTLVKEDGVGLAAPQVGICRCACVVLETNVEEGQDEYMIELVNPEILSSDGEQEGCEGCLSLPGKYGIVKRPEHVVVRAQDRFGKPFTVEGFGLTARAFCHEIDHLGGVVFTEKVERMLSEEELAEMYGGKEEEK